MDVRQVYSILNDVTSEVLGKTDLVNEDLTNIVDVGKEIFDNVSYDRYVSSLVDHIGKVIFVDRNYEGAASDLKRDDWEYGSVLEKIYGGIPDAVENESWELTDGASYDPNVFIKPKDVRAKFYNKKTTFEVDLSIADIQAKSAFSTPNQLNAFFSMLTNNVDKSLTIKMDALAERTINYLILNTIENEFPSVSDNDYSNSTGVKAINLLKLYNTQFSKSLTASACLYDADFIRYSALVMERVLVRLRKISTLFNTQGEPRFTPSSLQHVILHGDFKTAADVYLQSDTFHDEFTRLPKATEVPYWQGSGLTYAFSDTTAIKGTVKTAAGADKNIAISGVLGVVFDHDAAGIAQLRRRVTSNYNPKAEFTNYFYKVDCGYYVDGAENAIVFFAA